MRVMLSFFPLSSAAAVLFNKFFYRYKVREVDGVELTESFDTPQIKARLDALSELMLISRARNEYIMSYMRKDRITKTGGTFL